MAAVLAAVIVVGVGVFIFLSFQPGRSSGQTTAMTTHQTTAGSSVIALTLYLNDYGYNSSRGGPRIQAYVGDLIRIRLIGNGSGPIVHDFTLDEGSPSPYSIKSERLRRGQEQIIEFIANHPGVYSYYCSVRGFAGPSHRDRGQEGIIEILQRT